MSGVRFPDHFSESGFKLTYDHLFNDDFGHCPDCHLQIRRSEWNMKWDPYEYHKHYEPHCPWIKEEEAYIRAKQAYQAAKAEMAAQAKAKEEARIKSETQARQARMYAEQEARNARLEEEEKARIQAEEVARLEAFACRRCPAKFASNTKLHEHVRDHHTKSASPTPPASPKLSLSAITSIQIAPASPTPSPKPAPPLTPPATPPKTWAVVASKPTKPVPQPASKPASAASPLTSPPTPAQTSPQPLKPYLTIDDLYRMFHVKQPPHQTRITSFFKPMIEPVRNSKRNIHPTTKNIIKTQAPPPTSPESPNCKMATFQLRKLTGWSFQRYVSGLPLKMAPEKRFENTTPTASPTNGTTASKCPNYYGRHIKSSARRRRHAKDL